MYACGWNKRRLDADPQPYASSPPLVGNQRAQVAQHSDVLFVAVKPHVVSLVLNQVRPALTEKHLIVSIAAGITLQK